MKRLAVLAVLFPLAGCGQMTPTIDSGAIGVVVAQVQALTVKVCSFLPTDGTIVEIIKATQGGETVYAIANAICKAVTATSSSATSQGLFAADKKECPVVAGVCVEGQFVDPKEFEKLQEDPIPDENGVPAPATEPAPAPPAEGQ